MAKGFWGISWANSADPSDVVEPSGGKQAGGWEAGEKPPNHSFNWFWKKICDTFKNLNDQGVLEWDSVTSYPADAVVWYAGTMYVSNAGSNANHTPSSSSTFWQALREPNVVISASAPTNGKTGKLWINTTGGVNRLYGYISGSWLPVTDIANIKSADATGSANAIVASFAPYYTTNAEIVCVLINAALANTSSSVTLSCGGGVFWTVVKKNNQALRVGDISGAGHRLLITADVANSRFILLNPAEAPATQAEVNAGTIENANVTPKTFSEASATCKAWANFRYTGGVLTVLKSFNVTSITRVAQGRYQITFTKPMTDINYSVSIGNTAGQGGTNGAVYSSGGWDGAPNDKTVNTLTVSFGNGTDYRDCYDMSVQCFN